MQKIVAVRALVAQKAAVVMTVLVTAKLLAATMVAVVKIATITVVK